MNILLDTNIIIPLEDTSRILDSSFAELRKLSAEQQHCLYIHPIQFEDIKRDKKLLAYVGLQRKPDTFLSQTPKLGGVSE